MIGAIIVLYNPDIKQLKKGLDSLVNQVDEICLIDNSLTTIFLPHEYTNICYIPLYKNEGIAKAQNIGISYFLKKGNIKYILFSDQDSVAPSNIVKTLLDSSECLQSHGISVATVGTRAYNMNTGIAYSSKAKEYNRKFYNEINAVITECDSIRSSMTLTQIDVFKKVGGFDSSLFIDGVDNEWCWRAYEINRFRTFISENSKIDHMLGEGDRCFCGITIGVSSASRFYYQYRNFIILSYRSYVPKYWKIKNFVKYVFKFFYFPIFVSPRLKYLRNILKGLKDGMSTNKSYDVYSIERF